MVDRADRQRGGRSGKLRKREKTPRDKAGRGQLTGMLKQAAATLRGGAKIERRVTAAIEKASRKGGGGKQLRRRKKRRQSTRSGDELGMDRHPR